MQEALMFRDHPEAKHESESKPTDGPGSVSLFQVAAGIAAAGCLILMIADMAAPASFVPVQIRILLLMTAIGTLAIYLTMWSDARNQRRHDDLMATLHRRQRGEDYVYGYVHGVERRPPDPTMMMG